MIIDFTLNGKKTKIDIDPAHRLVDVLHNSCVDTGATAGCYAGECGTCVVLLDDELVYSCLTPMFAVRSRTVTTLEGIVPTRIYRDLLQGFDNAGFRPCDTCFQGKMLSLYSLLEQSDAPTKAQIDEVLLAQRCRCTDYSELLNVVNEVIGERRSRRRATRI